MLRAWLQKLLAKGKASRSAGPREFRPEVEALEVRYTPSGVSHHAAAHGHHRALTIAEYNPYTGQTFRNTYTDDGTWTGWSDPSFASQGYSRIGEYNPYTNTGYWNYYDSNGDYAGSWSSFWTDSGTGDDFWNSLGF
jgi:hypothetical protein